jgi:hypothetical protein
MNTTDTMSQTELYKEIIHKHIEAYNNNRLDDARKVRASPLICVEQPHLKRPL